MVGTALFKECLKVLYLLSSGGFDQPGDEASRTGERSVAQPEDDREDQGNCQRDAERAGLASQRSLVITREPLLKGKAQSGNTKGGSITVPLTSCLTGLDESVLQIKTKFVSCHIADSKQVKQEVNGTVILPPLVFPGSVQWTSSVR